MSLFKSYRKFIFVKDI